MPKIQYRIKDLPDFNSNTMLSLARRLWETKMYYEWARRPLLEIWRQCDDAYLCYRQLPHNEGMQWTDKSDFGETDIFDGVNMLATRLSLAMMPKDASWLTVVSRQGDDAKVVEAIQAQQLWMHDRAHTRRMVARHLKQLMVRGTSGLYVTWEHRERQRKLSTAEGRRRLKRLLKTGQIDTATANKIDDIYIPVTDYVGPKIRVIDSLDLYMDPAHDLSVDRRTSTIVATYRRLEELKLETDRAGNPLYENLEGLEPYTPTEIYMEDIEGSNRIRDLNTMGVFPQNQPYRNEGFVPVYVCYFPYYEHEGEKFFDTYFHLARSRQGKIARLIRIEQNPSEEGHQFLIKDTMVDWFGNTAYGISLVEKLLAKYNQKNVLAAITLEAALTSVFPAYLVMAGMLRDDTGISFSPGALTEVEQNQNGLKIIEPVPINPQGVQIGLAELRWWAENIATGFGEWGAISQGDQKSASNRETATSVNVKATSGSAALDELVEKFSVSMQELGQLCFDLSRQEMEPDKDGKIKFTKMNGVGSASEEGIDWDQFQAPRDIVVSGENGHYNRAQEIMNLNEAIKGIAQLAGVPGALPNAAQLIEPLMERLLNKMNVEIPPGAKMSDVALAVHNPEIQKAVIQDFLKKNPQIGSILQGAMSQLQQPKNSNGANPQPIPGLGQSG